MEEELPLRPLSNLVGRDGVAEVLPPGQCGAQQAQRLPCARRALQDAVHLLNGGSRVGGAGVRPAATRSPETSPPTHQGRWQPHRTTSAVNPKAAGYFSPLSKQPFHPHINSKTTNQVPSLKTGESPAMPGPGFHKCREPDDLLSSQTRLSGKPGDTRPCWPQGWVPDSSLQGSVPTTAPTSPAAE